MLEQHKIAVAAAVGIAAILMMTTALGLLQSTKTVTNTGNIIAVNVGVYQDSGCTQVLATINWGNLTIGSSTTTTIYVKNTGNAALTLNMTVTSWNPSAASSYITLTWDRQDSILTQGNNVPALLVLSVSANVNGFTDFNCTTIIAGNA